MPLGDELHAVLLLHERPGDLVVVVVHPALRLGAPFVHLAPVPVEDGAGDVVALAVAVAPEVPRARDDLHQLRLLRQDPVDDVLVPEDPELAELGVGGQVPYPFAEPRRPMLDGDQRDSCVDARGAVELLEVPRLVPGQAELELRLLREAKDSLGAKGVERLPEQPEVSEDQGVGVEVDHSRHMRNQLCQQEPIHGAGREELLEGVLGVDRVEGEVRGEVRVGGVLGDGLHELAHDLDCRVPKDVDVEDVAARAAHDRALDRQERLGPATPADAVGDVYHRGGVVGGWSPARRAVSHHAVRSAPREVCRRAVDAARPRLQHAGQAAACLRPNQKEQESIQGTTTSAKLIFSLSTKQVCFLTPQQHCLHCSTCAGRQASQSSSMNGDINVSIAVIDGE